MTIKISPSILGANFCNLEQDIKLLEANSISAIHIDVMDGNFVPNIAFGPDQVKMLRSVSTSLEFDVHLMVANPEILFPRLRDASANCITVHAEVCTHLYRTIATIKNLGIQAGVAVNPATALDALQYVLPLVDKILIMTVEPGFGGQHFIMGMLGKIRKLKNMQECQGSDFVIQVDGGINLENIKDVIECGATDIVIGSSIFRDNALEKNIREFSDVIIGSSAALRRSMQAPNA